MPDGSRLVVVRDITELKSREREIARERDAAEAARAEAEAANQAKSTFLAIMSHEIRTPMNGVLGLLELLEHQGISESQRAIVATMRSSASALLRIVDDVLDFSRIEAGRLELEETPFLLSELVGGTVDALRPQAMAKGLALSAELVPGSADALIGDATAGAADPVQPAGQCAEVHQRRQRACARGDQPARRGRIPGDAQRDRYGIGISEAERARLFRPFSQGDSSTTRRFGGSGLGLSIVRRLAQLMHGDVRVRNLPGKGSAFTVTLRLHAAGADDVVPVVATPQGLAALDASGGRVLVADDHPVNRQVLQGQLALLGLAVDTATDGMHALSLWQPGRYAVVLADMHMPRLDGYGLTAEIRAREAASRVSRTPIVAVTANATRGEEEHCLAGGMDAYLAKPVTLEGLGATLGRWITVTLPDEPLTPLVDRGLLRNWLGDDEAAVRSLLAEFLANARDNARDVETR